MHGQFEIQDKTLKTGTEEFPLWLFGELSFRKKKKTVFHGPRVFWDFFAYIIFQIQRKKFSVESYKIKILNNKFSNL
jgi:hypothetical protein